MLTKGETLYLLIALDWQRLLRLARMSNGSKLEYYDWRKQTL